MVAKGGIKKWPARQRALERLANPWHFVTPQPSGPRSVFQSWLEETAFHRRIVSPQINNTTSRHQLEKFYAQSANYPEHEDEKARYLIAPFFLIDHLHLDTNGDGIVSLEAGNADLEVLHRAAKLFIEPS